MQSRPGAHTRTSAVPRGAAAGGCRSLGQLVPGVPLLLCSEGRLTGGSAGFLRAVQSVKKRRRAQTRGLLRRRLCRLPGQIDPLARSRRGRVPGRLTGGGLPCADAGVCAVVSRRGRGTRVWSRLQRAACGGLLPLAAPQGFLSESGLWDSVLTPLEPLLSGTVWPKQTPAGAEGWAAPATGLTRCGTHSSTVPTQQTPWVRDGPEREKQTGGRELLETRQRVHWCRRTNAAVGSVRGNVSRTW